MRIERFHPTYRQESLLQQIDREMMLLGGGMLTDVDRFCLGDFDRTGEGTFFDRHSGDNYE